MNMGVQIETGFSIMQKREKSKHKVCNMKKFVLKGVVMCEDLDSYENRTRYQRDVPSCLYLED